MPSFDGSFYVYSSFLIPNISRNIPLNIFGLLSTTTFITPPQFENSKDTPKMISDRQSKNITAPYGRKLATIMPAVKDSKTLARFRFFSEHFVKHLPALIHITPV